MAKINKPLLKGVWAEAGAKVMPSDEKWQLGWTAEIPPHQWMNALQNRMDTAIAHNNQSGVNEWDAGTDYLPNSGSYVKGSDGRIYKSVNESGSVSPQNPVTDVAKYYWKEAFAEKGNVAISEVVALQTTLDKKFSLHVVGKSYLKGEVVGMSTGAAYVATQNTTTTPTDANTHWSKVVGARDLAGIAGIGLSEDNGKLKVVYGTTSGTAAQGNDSRIINSVQTSGDQTVGGIKTFSTFPVTPAAAPTADYQAANKKYVDDKYISHPSITGSITLNGTTDNTVAMSGIVTELGLEIGDVIRIDTGAYNKLHTVESITDDSSIIVNYEHAGNRGNGTLKLPDFTGTGTVTRIAKWYNAPIGLGQAWVNVSDSRVIAVSLTNYTNNTGRTIKAEFSPLWTTPAGNPGRTTSFIDGSAVSSALAAGVYSVRSVLSLDVTSGALYGFTQEATISAYLWMELR